MRPRCRRLLRLKRSRPRRSATANPNDGNWTVAQPADAKIRGDWWTIFNDPELNDLEAQLNINNQTIKQYFENFMEARALVRVARAQYFPTVGFGPSYSRSRSSQNLENNTSTANVGREGQIYTPCRWIFRGRPDLFGRIRQQVRNAQYTAQVSAADLENEKLVEQAEPGAVLLRDSRPGCAHQVVRGHGG